MGTFRRVELFKLAVTDGRPILEAFRPRRHRELDSDRYHRPYHFSGRDDRIMVLSFRDVIRRMEQRRQLNLFDL